MATSNYFPAERQVLFLQNLFEASASAISYFDHLPQKPKWIYVHLVMQHTVEW
jgi:hypothetical protein